jgi:Fe-S cluster assembly protein SufD
MHPRNLIMVGRQAKASVVESYVSTSDAMYFTNAVTEVSLADGATLQHYKMQREGARAFHVSTTETNQARDSHYVSFSFAIGGSLTRSNVYTTLDGEGGGATLNGLFMLDGQQHSDHQTQIIHEKPNCFSRPAVQRASSTVARHGVFNGKVYVRRSRRKQTQRRRTRRCSCRTRHTSTRSRSSRFSPTT